MKLNGIIKKQFWFNKLKRQKGKDALGCIVKFGRSHKPNKNQIEKSMKKKTNYYKAYVKMKSKSAKKKCQGGKCK